MRFNLIICTYKRSNSLLKLLKSVRSQSLYPSEILIIDGSPDEETKRMLQDKCFKNLKYFKVGKEDLGLTRQRNFGVRKSSKEVEIITFLDDDTVLTLNYFENLIGTYKNFPDAVGVGGYILEDKVHWKRNTSVGDDEYGIDGFKRKFGSRNFIRKKMGLLSDRLPGFMPKFSNGLPIGFLPPSGKTYPVEYFMGGVASYRKEIFEKINFSPYFEGYGLYEDMDFCLRVSKLGQLYVSTAAELYHEHEETGRPDFFKYGKMVIRNGWYVWRVKYPSPSFKNRIKWHAIALLLTLVRIGNIFSTPDKKKALVESTGRLVGWWSLFYHEPRLKS